MRKLSLTLLAISLVAAALSAQPQRPRQGDLKVGDDAPDFKVSDLKGKTTVKLADLQGKPVVLIFGSCT